MVFHVPDLNYSAAMDFCKKVNSYVVRDNDTIIEIDFNRVGNCDPFPMLMVSTAIRNMRKKNRNLQFIARNCNNRYAEYMKFYNACGINLGADVEYSRGNGNYSCITKLSIEDLYTESHENLDYIQETIEKKSKEMSKVLCREDKEFQNWMTFVIRELLRNIPEHSQSRTIWYCAQYWPSHDLVELAILDEGIGISKSLADSYEFKELYKNDYEALQLALEPGVSGTFSSTRRSIGTGDWQNSGYGLYMVSQMCAELGASFIIASGDSAIRIAKENGEIKQTKYDTHMDGTAIQIRIRPSKNVNYEQVRRDILKRGEELARSKDYTIHSASKSSRGLF